MPFFRTLIIDKIEKIESVFTQRQNEILALHTQLADTSQQLKQIAVAALHRESNPSQSAMK